MLTNIVPSISLDLMANVNYFLKSDCQILTDLIVHNTVSEGHKSNNYHLNCPGKVTHISLEVQSIRRLTNSALTCL